MTASSQEAVHPYVSAATGEAQLQVQQTRRAECASTRRVQPRWNL